MEVIILLFRQLFVMFILLLIGIWLFHFKKVSVQGSKEFGNLLLYIVIPIVIIKSFCIEVTYERFAGLGAAFLLSIVSLGISILISNMIFKNKYPLDNFAASFSNAGFIGIPLVDAVVGNEAVFYIASYIALLNILQWTYGLVIITKQRSYLQIHQLLKNPIVIATCIGLCIFFLRLPVPEDAYSIMNSISSLNTPIAMMITGVCLAQVPFTSLYKNIRLMKCSLVRLLLIPFVTLLIFTLFDFISVPIRLTILIAVSAPVGSNITIFSSLYNKDYIYSVQTVCYSTLFSIVTLPLMIMLAQLVF